MSAGIGTIGNAVAVDIEIAPEALCHGFKVFAAQHFAAVIAIAVVKFQRRRHPLVHAEIKIAHDNDGCLQAFREVKGFDSHAEAFGRRGREKQYVLGIAMRGISGGEDIGLLGAGGHARRGACSLHINQNRRDLCEIGQTKKFAHQRDARTTGCGKSACAIPVGANDHAHG